jgi:hypothetical protein
MRIPRLCLLIMFSLLGVTGASCKNLELREAQFVPTPLDVQNTFDRTVALQVTGGRDLSRVVFEQPPRDSFLNALLSAIEQQRIFRDVVTSSTADYLLTVELSDFVRVGPAPNPLARDPLTGLPRGALGTTSVFELKTTWKLVRLDNQTVVWGQTLIQQGLSTAWEGGQRTRDARERAVNATITEGLRLLSRLTL